MSTVVRIATLGAEPIGLDDMKNALKVPPGVTADDNKILRLIRTARQQCELISNCAIVRAKYVQYHDQFPGWRVRDQGYFQSYINHGAELRDLHQGKIKIRKPPLVSCDGLEYIGTDGQIHPLKRGTDYIVDPAQRPARIRPMIYTVWPLTMRVPNAVRIPFTAGFDAPADPLGDEPTAQPQNITQGNTPTWMAGATYLQYRFVMSLDQFVWIQTNSPSGAVGASRPAFEGQAVGAIIASDGTAAWLNVGKLQGNWEPSVAYAGANAYVLLDGEGSLQLLIVANLVSQTTPGASPDEAASASPAEPAWNQNLGGLTTDNGVPAWRCLGLFGALGNDGATAPNSPEQQASYVEDLTLPDTVVLAIEYLVNHWYYNREPVAAGPANSVPHTVYDLLGDIAVHDFNPTLP